MFKIWTKVNWAAHIKVWSKTIGSFYVGILGFERWHFHQVGAEEQKARECVGTAFRRKSDLFA